MGRLKLSCSTLHFYIHFCSIVHCLISIFAILFWNKVLLIDKISASNQVMNTVTQLYDEKHCTEVMKMLNVDRKAESTSCDGILQADGREYPVHKSIVAVVSEYLKNLFFTEMREKYEKVVKVSNMTDVVLGNILEFIYTGFVKLTLNNVFDLLEGAEYMRVDGLKNNCKDYLVQSTSVENCLKFRAYGQRYNLDEVCDASDQVIAENFSDVIQQEDFNELDSDAITELLNTRRERTCEEMVFSCIVRWVNHNLTERQELFLKLFTLVDLSALSQTFLNEHVLSEPLVFNSLQCFQHLHNPSKPLIFVASTSGKATVSKANADKFVLIGGEGSEKSCVTYDSKGKHPLQLPELNERRRGAAVVKIKHCLYLAGGSKTLSPCQSAEMLNLKDLKKWVKIADMLEGKILAASAVLSGRMVVTGGMGTYDHLRSCEIYNCELDQWIGMKPMLRARAFHGMVSLNGLLYCIGGHETYSFSTGDISFLSSAECYDEKIDEWKEIAPMPTARIGLALVALNDFIYAIGGSNESFLTRVERYSPETNTWTNRGDLNVARHNPGVCVMNGKIYVIGGQKRNNVHIKSVEVYDEARNKWEICFDMDTSAFGSAVVVL